MFTGSYFAKTFFAGRYFEPSGAGPGGAGTPETHTVGMMKNPGTLMGRR